MSDTLRARPLAETLAAMALTCTARALGAHLTVDTRDRGGLAQEAGTRLECARDPRVCSPSASWKSSSFPHPAVWLIFRWAVRR